jgi:hypothetical protein
MEEAQQVLVLAPANRIFNGADTIPSNVTPAWHGSWKGISEKVTLVICGDREGRERRLRGGLRGNGLRVYWMDGVRGEELSEGELVDDLCHLSVQGALGDLISQVIAGIGQIRTSVGKDYGVVLKLARGFIADMFELHELCEAFEKSTNISGSGGVAERLGLTRGAVYCRLSRLELNKQDLVDFASDPIRLIDKSEYLKDRVRELHKTFQGME